MKLRHPLIDCHVVLEISEKPGVIQGKLIDIGQDILILHNGAQYVYVPLIHLHQLRVTSTGWSEGELAELPFETQNESISYRKMLMNAKGMFSEIYVDGNKSLHGYVTSVMNDFFVFYSPVHHSVIVSLRHLKYLIPYPANMTPYALTPEQFPLKPSPITLARTFDQQLRKLIGEFVVLDLGDNPNKIGVLRGLEQNMVELSMADGNAMFVHFDHVKTVHLP